jgi:uncharacterized membrane protein YfcA
MKLSREVEIEQEILENTNKICQKIKDEENNPLRWSRIKILIVFLLITLVDQILEGNSRLPSLLGIAKCSGIFWIFFISYCVISYYSVKYAFSTAYLNYNYKKTVSPNEEISNFEVIGKNINKIVILTFLGGIVAGMLGIGGGMIITPLLLSFGVDPKGATSTSNLLIVFSAFTATIMFVFSVK